MTKSSKKPINRIEVEERALKVSSGGALALAALGIGFAISSGSNAILLDGLFSALGFVMALLTLKVSRLVRRPDDEVFQYGYAHFAPLINVLKSLTMSAVCIFALLSAIGTIAAGGRALAVGSAVLYALLATIIGAVLYVYLGKAAARSGSALVGLDAKTAQLDMFLSAAVLISFLLGWLAMGTDLEPWIDYLDPGLVLVLCLVALPMPLKVLWNDGREALLLAPDPALQETVKEKIGIAVKDIPVAQYRIRMLKLGNVVALTLHLKLSDDYPIESLGDLDRIRQRIGAALEPVDFEIGLDVLFVSDMSLAR